MSISEDESNWVVAGLNASRPPIVICEGLKSASEVGSCGMVSAVSSGVMAMMLPGESSMLGLRMAMAPLRDTLVDANRPPALIAGPSLCRMIEPRALSIRPVASLTRLLIEAVEIKFSVTSRPRIPGTVLSAAPVAACTLNASTAARMTCPSVATRWPAFSMTGDANRM